MQRLYYKLFSDNRWTSFDSTVQSDLVFYGYDHLGNTRVTFKDATSCSASDHQFEVVSMHDYYPFGKVLRAFTQESERHLTTQHPRDAETDWDYRGARFYDSDIGRFLGVDPLAVNFLGWNPYNYTLNNPLRFIDPDGRSPKEGGPSDPKPTTITLTYSYTLRSSDVPFVETYRSATGSFTQLTGLSVTDISLGDEGGGYVVNVRTPRVYAHNRNYPIYTTQSFKGSDFDNLEREENTSLVGAFFDGMKVGITTALAEEALNAGAFSKYKVPSNFKVRPSEKVGGIRFTDPRNAQNEIRMMRGNPNSQNVRQQNPYVTYKHKGAFYDVKGNHIKSGAKSEAAHIPLKDYNPSVMPKFE